MSLHVVVDEQGWGLPSFLRGARTCNARQRVPSGDPQSREAGPAGGPVEPLFRGRDRVCHVTLVLIWGPLG